MNMNMNINVKEIELDLIDVPNGRRKLDPNWIGTLADLIETDGQITPIEVIEAAAGRYRLISGAHRVAARRLKLAQTIQATVWPTDAFASEAQIKLREIAENFARRELSVLDRAMDVAAWREIYEAAKGTVKRGPKAKHEIIINLDNNTVEDSFATAAETFAAKFPEAAQKALGLSQVAVYRALKIATITASVREQIALHPLADNQSELIALAACPVEKQGPVANLVITGKAPNILAALLTVENREPPVSIARWERISETFSRLKDHEQQAFFNLHEDAILKWVASRVA